MQDTYLTQVLLPLVLAFILFGMGLSLTIADFTRIIRIPKAAIVGLIGQLILLPLLAFFIAVSVNAPTEIAIGIMILAACPGGTTSNLICHLARANLALSVSLTAVATVVCVFTTPLIIIFSVEYFSGQPVQEFSILQTSLSLIVILVVPIALGMLTRYKARSIARRTEPYFRYFAVVFMLLLIAAISYSERDMLMASFPDVFVVMFSLNVLATIMGILLAKLTNLSDKDGLTLGIEVGTQNSTIAILIAVSFLQHPDYAIAAGVYGVFMYLGATLLVLYSKTVNSSS